MQGICEECGLTKADWKANYGKGFERDKVRFCCQGCFLGIGCSCKETGVRRVVVVGQPLNPTIRKTGRQVKEWKSKVAAIEKRAKDRRAAAPQAAEKAPATARDNAATFRKFRALAGPREARVKAR